MSFCILPWIHTYIHPNGDVYPCCHSTSSKESKVGNIKENSIEEIANSKKMKSLRLDMLAGAKSNMCSKCYNMEDAGIISHRIRHNKFFEKYNTVVNSTTTDGNIEPNIKFLDVRFSNLCNLKCRMCYHELSSSIASEEKRKTIFVKSLPDYDIFEKQYTNIERIYFAGGEPLLMNEHINMLHKLINLNLSNNIDLTYNSNITNLSFKGNNFADLWNKFKSVNISASIDAVGKRGEYIRHGINWNKIEENINTLNKYVSINYSLTVSTLNVASIIDTHMYLSNNNITASNRLHLSYVMSPSYYSAKIIPNNLRKNIIADIEIYINKIKDDPFVKELSGLITFLKNSTHDPILFKKFLLESAKKDSLRNENLFDVLPEYKSSS